LKSLIREVLAEHAGQTSSKKDEEASPDSPKKDKGQDKDTDKKNKKD